MDNNEREPKPEKVAVVDEVRGKFSDARGVVLTEYRGLNVAAMAELRNALRDVGGDYKVYKNTLVRRAVNDLGIEGLDEMLVGPTAVAFSDTDAVSLAKTLKDFAKTNEALVIKGGLLGDKTIDDAGVKALADLPSREPTTRPFGGWLCRTDAADGQRAWRTARKFAYALNTLIDQKDAA